MLAPLNGDVDAVKELEMSKFSGGEPHTFFSAYSLGDSDNPNLYPPELFNTFTPSSLPPHNLQLKEGAPIILLRNLDARNGACIGTRMIVRKLSKNVIEAEVVTRPRRCQRFFIPRVTLSRSEDSYLLPYADDNFRFE